MYIVVDNNGEIILAIKRCNNCGKKFNAISNHKTCSEKCSKERRKETRKLWEITQKRKDYKENYFIKNKKEIYKQRKKLREKRKKLGLCINCGRKTEGHVFCEKCLRRIGLWNKKRRKEIKFKVLSHYGGNPPKCACCGENNVGFLTIDHILGDGNKHRKKIGQSNIYYWLIRNNFPKGYQVLCYNCNLGKAHNDGVCPHKGVI